MSRLDHEKRHRQDLARRAEDEASLERSVDRAIRDGNRARRRGRPTVDEMLADVLPRLRRREVDRT